MTRLPNNQQGIGHVVLIVAVVVVAAVAAVGYRVSQNTSATDNSATHTAAVPTDIKSKNDVRQAQRALDGTAVDGNVNPNQLDSDLNALL